MAICDRQLTIWTIFPITYEIANIRPYEPEKYMNLKKIAGYSPLQLVDFIQIIFRSTEGFENFQSVHNLRDRYNLPLLYFAKQLSV